jgi:peroxiredoxin/glutaredoxin
MLKNLEGQLLPDVTFHTRAGDQWKDVTTSDVFAKKRVVAFALPGAFTPTCSTSHLPRYNELAEAFKAQGIDAVVCISVNDPFVMNEWAKDQDAEHISFLPDGNGEFTQAMGMLVDKKPLGLGKRSWRYSMLVENRTITKMFIEPEVDGDPYQVSDADTMLRYLDPSGAVPSDIVLFTKPGCSFCAKAKAILDSHKWVYDEVPSSPRRLRAVSGKSTTPQIFIAGKYIGGADELEAYFRIHQ